jgi:hypothetical protein
VGQPAIRAAREQFRRRASLVFCFHVIVLFICNFSKCRLPSRVRQLTAILSGRVPDNFFEHAIEMRE